MISFRSVLAGVLAVSLLANIALFIYVSSLQETNSMVPRLKNELKTITSVIPKDLAMEETAAALRSAGYEVQTDGEYYYAPRPNETLSVGTTYFVFSPSGRLMQIYSLSDSMDPIYDHHNQAHH